MNFTGQWLISRSADPVPYLKKRVSLPLGFYLHLNNQAHLEVFKGDGFEIFVVGVFVNNSSVNSNELNEQNILDWIIGNVGNYCVIKASDNDIRLYTDPGGLMGIYYRGDQYSSSVSLLGEIEHNEYFRYFSKADDWFLGDLTPFKNIKCLLANHSISLIDKEPKRFWPRKAFGTLSWEKGIELTANSLKSSINQLVSKYDVLASITGGKDSRLVMAAAIEKLSEIEFFTLEGNGIPKDDIAVVKDLIKKIGIHHTFLTTVSPCKDDLDIYDQISGGLSLGARREIISSMDQFKGKGLVHLNGNLGAIGKCYYWPPAGQQFHEEFFLSDFSSVSPDKRKGLSIWLDSLPDYLSKNDICNLMYLEQRGGRWIGIGENASSFIFQSFTPFSSRAVFELVCMLPNEELEEKDWHYEITVKLSAELSILRYSMSTRKYMKLLPGFLRRAVKKIKSKIL